MGKPGKGERMEKQPYLATAAFGLEGLVAEELKGLGIKGAKAEQGGATPDFALLSGH